MIEALNLLLYCYLDSFKHGVFLQTPYSCVSYSNMNPFSIFLLLLIIVPVVEIYFLIQVGTVIGAFSTVVLILATAVLGAYLFRVQGVATVHRIQAVLSRGEIPAVEMIEGAMLLVSGALLLTPGFVTDAIGFFCLISGLRRRFAKFVLANQFMPQSRFQENDPFQQRGRGGHGLDDHVIEGEFKREDEPDRESKKDNE